MTHSGVVMGLVCENKSLFFRTRQWDTEVSALRGLCLQG
jgi:hypothetical protein